MLDQFSRFQMMIGKDSIDSLKKKRIIVFGIGGVGGNVCDALVRSGITQFALVDPDKVDITNINRQYVANLDTVGQYKVDVMERHLLSISKEVKVEKYKIFYLPETAGEIDLSKYDYVIDAVDTVIAKIEIIKKCKELNIPVISALGCGNKINPTDLEVSDISKTSYDPLAKVIRRELRKLGINHLKVVFSKESPISNMEESLETSTKRSIPSSSPFVPPVAGIIIASEVVKDLVE